MAYSVLNLKADLTGIIHGTTLNKVQNLDGVIDRAARQLLLDVDPQETKRIAQFATPIFENVYTYALAADVKGNKIIDIRPQVNRLPGSVFNSSYAQQFNLSLLTSLLEQFTINWNGGIRTIQVSYPLLNTGVTVNGATSITDNGTWSVGGGASNLTENDQNFVFGSSSLSFNLDAGQSTGYIENSTMTPVDLTDFLNLAYWFLYTYLPTASSVTAINLRFGSSSSNYYSVSTSVTQANTAFQNGWNLLSYLWSNASTTGTPDDSAINYLRITYTYDSTLQTGVLVNNITSRLGQIMEYVYYSQYLFRNASTSVFQETVLDDSDLINLNTDSYNLLLNQVCVLAAQQLQGADAERFDYKFFQAAYDKGVQKYNALYKSEVQKPTATYYKMPNPGQSQYFPRRFGR